MTIPNLPHGFVEFCAAHNVARCGCLADRMIEDVLAMSDEETHGVDADLLAAIQMRAIFEQAAASIPRVSLPNKPAVEQTPAEETQEPSGWRDKPAML